LASEGLDAPVIQLDVDDARSVASAMAEVTRLFGRLDVLVNNAAVLIDGPGLPISNVLGIPEDIVARTYNTNTIGPLRLMQHAIPMMVERGHGRIVNLSSGAGQLAEMGGGYPAYRMSKSALNALTRVAAAETTAGNVKINAMCPGWVKTDMGGPNATRSIPEGADTAVWLATLPDDGPTGGFFRDRKPIAW